MSIALHLLTIFAFAAHVIAGCCAHHGHAVHSQSSASEVMAVHALHAGKHQHCHHAHSSSDHNDQSEATPVSEEPEHDHETCKEGSCSFLHSRTLTLSLPLFTTWDSVEALVSTATKSAIRESTFGCDRPHDGLSSHCSRCALRQLWLL